MENKENLNIKIKNYETLKGLFTFLTTVSAIITFLDLIIPDAILFLDEAALASVTGVFVFLITFFDKKIDELRSGKDAKITPQELTEISSVISDSKKTKKEIKQIDKKD